ncbi:MAG: phage tail protein [Chloroflexi bacterium]|nr:MAG: phage tail protein [Chloroflexota bacterium]PIE79687.1 MAG: phage tail protein [Chloroflexota bacterium]
MAEREDPLVGFHFGIEVQGVISGFFTECSGIGSEQEVIEHKVISETGQEMVMKLPGRLKWENITLKRGITSNMDIWDWRKQVEDGDVEAARHNGSIVMYDQQLNPVARWNFEKAWPVKVTGPQPKSDSNDIGVEELTIAHEYIERVQ